MWNWITQAEALRQRGQSFVIATVTQVTGSTPREGGAKLIFSEERFWGTVGGGNFEKQVLEDARNCLNQNESQVIRYPLGAKTGQCCGGVMEVLFEPIHCGPLLYLFGGGHVGQAICKVLQGTPFDIHLIDERPEWIQSAELPLHVIRHATEWSEFIDQAKWCENRVYAVIMTHRHDQDQEILQALLGKSAKYLGLIGSQAKWLRFQQRLQVRGIEKSHLERVRCPIGLPIGGKAPQEVAISLAAELLKLHYRC